MLKNTNVEEMPVCRVTVVIVNYGKATRAASCLRSLRRQSMIDRMNIVVVDNSLSQSEGSVLFNAVSAGEHLIIANENLGYSRGVNFGISKVAKAEYILLVSPDIIVEDTVAIEKMVSLMDSNSSFGALASMQHNDDGTPVEIARRFPKFSHHILRRVVPSKCSELSLQDQLASGRESLLDVDWVQSSFLILRSDLWDQIGGLDERYYVFMSDADLCRQVHEKGFRVIVTSHINVQADGRRASAGTIWTVFTNKALRIHIRDALIYYASSVFNGRRLIDFRWIFRADRSR